jgi:hypothetical protein
MLLGCSLVVIAVVHTGFHRGWSTLLSGSHALGTWSWVSPAVVGILAGALGTIALVAIIWGKRVPRDPSRPELGSMLIAFLLERSPRSGSSADRSKGPDQG